MQRTVIPWAYKMEVSKMELYLLFFLIDSLYCASILGNNTEAILNKTEETEIHVASDEVSDILRSAAREPKILLKMFFNAIVRNFLPKKTSPIGGQQSVYVQLCDSYYNDECPEYEDDNDQCVLISGVQSEPDRNTNSKDQCPEPTSNEVKRPTPPKKKNGNKKPPKQEEEDSYYVTVEEYEVDDYDEKDDHKKKKKHQHYGRRSHTKESTTNDDLFRLLLLYSFLQRSQMAPLPLGATEMENQLKANPQFQLLSQVGGKQSSYEKMFFSPQSVSQLLPHNTNAETNILPHGEEHAADEQTSIEHPSFHKNQEFPNGNKHSYYDKHPSADETHLFQNNKLLPNDDGHLSYLNQNVIQEDKHEEIMKPESYNGLYHSLGSEDTFLHYKKIYGKDKMNKKGTSVNLMRSLSPGNARSIEGFLPYFLPTRFHVFLYNVFNIITFNETQGEIGKLVQQTFTNVANFLNKTQPEMVDMLQNETLIEVWSQITNKTRPEIMTMVSNKTMDLPNLTKSMNETLPELMIMVMNASLSNNVTFGMNGTRPDSISLLALETLPAILDMLNGESDPGDSGNNLDKFNDTETQTEYFPIHEEGFDQDDHVTSVEHVGGNETQLDFLSSELPTSKAGHNVSDIIGDSNLPFALPRFQKSSRSPRQRPREHSTNLSEPLAITHHLETLEDVTEFPRISKAIPNGYWSRPDIDPRRDNPRPSRQYMNLVKWVQSRLQQLFKRPLNRDISHRTKHRIPPQNELFYQHQNPLHTRSNRRRVIVPSNLFRWNFLRIPQNSRFQSTESGTPPSYRGRSVGDSMEN